MKYLGLAILFAIFHVSSNAQAFEGQLFYEQQQGSVKTLVDIQLTTGQSHILRREAMPLHYVLRADGSLLAWADVSARPDRVSVPRLERPNFVGKSSSKVMSGLQVKSFQFTLPNGDTFSGWYSTDLQVDHNALIAPVQGISWGVLPENGVLVRWELKSAKGAVMVSGQLLNHVAGPQPASAFVFPEAKP